MITFVCARAKMPRFNDSYFVDINKRVHRSDVFKKIQHFTYRYLRTTIGNIEISRINRVLSIEFFSRGTKERVRIRPTVQDRHPTSGREVWPPTVRIEQKLSVTENKTSRTICEPLV